MRVLFASTRGAGHVGPLLPFAGAFARAGADLRVAIPRSAAATVEESGLTAWPLEDPPEGPRAAVIESALGLSPDDANAKVMRELFAGLDARAALPGLRDAIASWRADVVIHETAAMKGLNPPGEHDSRGAWGGCAPRIAPQRWRWPAWRSRRP
jgi:hypothetical protein